MFLHLAPSKASIFTILAASLLHACGPAPLANDSANNNEANKNAISASTLEAQMDANIATIENIADYELIAPQLSEQDLEDIALNERLEKDMAYLAESYERAPNPAPQRAIPADTPSNLVIEMFHNSKNIGKQFMIVRHNNEIRYVFAISTGKSGALTPSGTFNIEKQRWRHMSTTYPSNGENNMDHSSYFLPVYAVHSTTFGVYSMLGKRDSHGCVRLARPQARALYTLIKYNGGSAKIISRSSGEPAEHELKTIKKALADDLNFIQKMLRKGNRGDVPFTEAEYFQYRAGQLDKKIVKEKMKKAGIKDILEAEEVSGKGSFFDRIFGRRS